MTTSSRKQTTKKDTAGRHPGASSPAQANEAPVKQEHPGAAFQRIRRAMADDPRAINPADILLLQRTIGNEAVNRLLSGKIREIPPKSQPKELPMTRPTDVQGANRGPAPESAVEPRPPARPSHIAQASPVIQRALMKPRQFQKLTDKPAKDDTLQTLTGMLKRYKPLSKRDRNKEAAVHQRLAQLDDMQQTIHGWFREHSDEPDHKYTQGMLALLDNIKEEHRELIKVTVEKGHKLWTPDRAKMEQAESEQLDEVWKTLVESDDEKAPLRITSRTLEDSSLVSENFREDMLANFARLLSRPVGRKLTTDLVEKSKESPLHQVTVAPFHPDAMQMGEEAKVDPRANELAYAKPEGNNVTQENKKGSGSIVRLAPGASDSASMAHDKEGRAILSPDFVSFGHEMIHVRHNLTGSNLKNVNTKDYEKGQKYEAWDNREEHSTIDLDQETSENLIREEHNLPKRYGHTGAKREIPVPPPQSKKRKGCFITTACIEAQGLPDNCYELTVLRVFRDGYMSRLPGGEKLIADYYEIAPDIVEHIQAQPDAPTILADLYRQVVKSVEFIEAGNNEAALQNYIAIVLKLKEQYL